MLGRSLAGSKALEAIWGGSAGLQLIVNSAIASSTRGFAAEAATPSDNSNSSSSSAQQEQQQQHTPLYAAAVVERLPIVKTVPPELEAECRAKLLQLQLQNNKLKLYPNLDGKQQRDAGEQEGAAAAAAAAGPSSTAADASGATNTMKRRLQDKLVLLVKANSNALTAAAAAGSSTAGGGSSSGASWTFPHTSHQPGESIRQAAERALKESIGLSQVYFVGNAPMAHLDIQSSSSSSSSSKGGSEPSSSSSSVQEPQEAPASRVFFHLAQVVNDPWEVDVVDGVASDFAWVTKDELGQYIQDEQLLQLAHKML